MNLSKHSWPKITNNWLVFTLCCFMFACSDKRFPEIRFASDTVKLGSIVKGEIDTLKFAYTNVGNSDLIVKDVKTHCECTSIESYKQHLKPNETAELVVVFKSSKEVKLHFQHPIVLVTNCNPILHTLFYEGQLIVDKNLNSSTNAQ
jgi:hypothetical protein